MSGHIHQLTIDGAHYFLLFLEDSTAYKFVALLRNKDEFIDALNQLIIQLGQAPKILQINNEGAMISERAYQFYESMLIWVEVVNVYEHFQAGRIESAIGSVSMRVLVMLVASGLPWVYWGFAVRYAVECENRLLPARPDSTVTCWEAFHGRAPDNSILHPFGCLAYLHINVNRRQLKKLADTSVSCVFLGFSTHLGHKARNFLTENHYIPTMRSGTSRTNTIISLSNG
eukprot:3215685-Rhodomonas_salina.1